MKPIRVLQVVTDMSRGGIEIMLMNYYRYVDRSRIQFDFLVHRSEPTEFEEEILGLGGKIYRMPAISPRNYFRYRKALSTFFDDHPEYTIIHSHLNALSAIVLSMAKKKGIPVRIAHSHIAVEPFVLQNIFKKNTDITATIKDSIHSVLRYFIPKYATHFFACGEKAGSFLFGKKNSSKVKVINNAIDAEAFIYNSEISKQIKKELNLTGKKIIGHVGVLREQKNHFFLLHIFKVLVSKKSDLRLILVGDGPLRPQIENEIKSLNLEDNVVLLGIRKNIPELLQIFDLFLFPSHYEGLPLTMVEAQAAGLRIVASDTITKEVNITNLVANVSLKESFETWADIVLEQLDYNRENKLEEIRSSGYDIKHSAKILQDFYINKQF